MVITSEVDVDVADGKGGIKLDWSSYDILDKYFVVYRKQEGEDEWKTVVSLDEKFNGSYYIDSLGNDKAVPDIPKISIKENEESNEIQIYSNATDNGSKYLYYIEAYDNKGLLLAISEK